MNGSRGSFQMEDLPVVGKEPSRRNSAPLGGIDLLQGRPPTVANLKAALQETSLRRSQNALALRSAGEKGQALLAESSLLDEQLQELRSEWQLSSKSLSPRPDTDDSSFPRSSKSNELRRQLTRLRLLHESLTEELEEKENELQSAFNTTMTSEWSEPQSPSQSSPTLTTLQLELADAKGAAAKAANRRQQEISALQAEIREVAENSEITNAALERQIEAAQTRLEKLRAEVSAEREETARQTGELQSRVDQLHQDLVEMENLLFIAQRARSSPSRSLGSCTPGGASSASHDGSEVWGGVRDDLSDAACKKLPKAKAPLGMHCMLPGTMLGGASHHEQDGESVGSPGRPTTGSLSGRASRARPRRTVSAYKKLDEVLPLPPQGSSTEDKSMKKEDEKKDKDDEEEEGAPSALASFFKSLPW